MIVVLLMSAVGFTVYRVRQNQGQPAARTSESNQDYAQQSDTLKSPEPSVAKDIDTLGGTFYTIVVRDQTYYGRVADINSDFLLLSDVFYADTQYGSQTSLVKLGNELHGPEDEMFVNRQYVKKLEELDTNGATYQAIETYGLQKDIVSISSSDISSYLKSDEYQALFVSDGKVYFTKVEFSGDGIAYPNPIYTLTVQYDSQDSQATQALSLQLVDSTDFGYNSYDDLVFWENLKPDSNVTTAIEQYESSR